MNGRAVGDNTLLLLTSLTEKRAPDGRLMLGRKFLESMCEFARLWQGGVRVVLEARPIAEQSVDSIALDSGDLPFQIECISLTRADQRERIGSARLVLASLIPRLAGVAELCAAENVPLVYEADNPLVVREGILRVETRNPLLYWRRRLWTRRLETRYRAAIPQARGIQCNGQATFDAYGALTPRSLLFLNTRVRRAMLATEQERAARRARLLENKPLRLVYSGRLIAIKGVLDLPRVAAALKRCKVPFTLDIYGGGALQNALERSVEILQLTDCVRVHGELPFPDLVRRVAGESDLFVVCHPQGDPSTTFLETMSCGVPCIGYGMEGLRDIVNSAGAGWLTPRAQPELLAARIAALDTNRSALVKAAEDAFAFARVRTFEELMRVRIEHLQQCLEGDLPQGV